ncbi:MAG: VTT domain-containing protein [Actinomycetota bacterium]|nr:VTT domain-containing protein [Actinomycetota bacterium]
MAGPVIMSLGWFSLSSAGSLSQSSAADWLSQVSASAQSVAATSYPVMVGLVLFGSVIPVVPTGAIVAAASALALTTSGFSVGIVVVLAAAAAFTGDVITFVICRSQGSRALDLLMKRNDSSRLDWARDQVANHAWRLIIVGRVLPAARIPVLFAAGSLRYPWVKFLPVEVTAALIWAVLYAAVGVLGGALFDSPLIAVAAAVVLALLVTAVPALYRRVRARQAVSAS